MDDNKKFPEQEAPEKNTDNAYVQVGEDGSPVMPHTNKDNEQSNTDNGSPTTLDKR